MLLYFKIFSGVLTLVILSFFLSFLLFKGNINQALRRMLVYRIILGSVFLAVILAILMTKGKTSMLMCLIPLLLSGRFLKQPELPNVKDGAWSNVIIFLFFILISTFSSYIRVKGIDFNDVKITINDYAYYATITQSIYESGLETKVPFSHLLADLNMNNLPFHYYESWLSIPIKYFFGYNMHLVVNSVVVVFCMSLCFYAIFYIFRYSLGYSPAKAAIFSIPTLFIRGVFHYSNGLNESLSYATDSILYDGNIKLIYVLPVFLLFCSEMIKGNFLTALAILLILPGLNFLFLPVIGVFMLFIIVIYLFMIGKGLATVNLSIKRIIILSLFYLGSVYLYILILGEGSKSNFLVTSVGGILSFVFVNLKNYFFINGIAVFTLLYLLSRNKNSNIIVFSVVTFLFIISGVFANALLDNGLNSWQIGSFTYRLSVYMLFLAIIAVVNSQCVACRLALPIVAAIGFFMFYENFNNMSYHYQTKITNYSEDYVHLVSEIKFERGGHGIKIVNPAIRPNYQKNPAYCGVINYSAVTDNIMYAVVLNPEDLYDKKVLQDKNIDISEASTTQLGYEVTFYSPLIVASGLSKRLKMSVNEYSLEKRKFLNKYNPEFCIVDPNMRLYDDMRPFVRDSFVDVSSGERFYLLDQLALNKR
jgi:hypothetical protein